MANVDSAFGLRPVGHLQGLDWSDKINWYYVPATDSTAIFQGDLVTHQGTSDAAGKFPTVAQAAAGDVDLVGVAVAFRTDPPDSQPVSLAGDNDIPRKEYRPASKAYYIGVVDDPYVIFEAQEDGNAGIAGIGSAFDVVVGSGSTTTALSGMEIDSDTSSATDGQLKVLRAAYTVDGSNDATAANANWLCIINEHLYKQVQAV